MVICEPPTMFIVLPRCSRFLCGDLVGEKAKSAQFISSPLLATGQNLRMARRDSPKTVALCSHLLSTQLQTTPSPLFRLLPPPVTLNRPELPLAPGSLQIPSTPLQSNQSPAPSTLSTKSHSHCLQPWNERAGTIASPQIGRYLTYLTSDHWPPRSNKAI